MKQKILGERKWIFEGLWEGIKVVFSPVTEWFGEKFDKGYEGIKKAWSFIESWFSKNGKPLNLLLKMWVRGLKRLLKTHMML